LSGIPGGLLREGTPPGSEASIHHRGDRKTGPPVFFGRFLSLWDLPSPDPGFPQVPSWNPSASAGGDEGRIPATGQNYRAAESIPPERSGPGSPHDRAQGSVHPGSGLQSLGVTFSPVHGPMNRSGLMDDDTAGILARERIPVGDHQATGPHDPAQAPQIAPRTRSAIPTGFPDSRPGGRVPIRSTAPRSPVRTRTGTREREPPQYAQFERSHGRTLPGTPPDPLNALRPAVHRRLPHQRRWAGSRRGGNTPARGGEAREPGRPGGNPATQERQDRRNPF
jgi:hypothetical protein